LPVAIGYSATTASTGVLTVNTVMVDKQVFGLKVVMLCRFFLASSKGLSHEIDFKNVERFTELGLKIRDAAGLFIFRGSNDFIMQKVHLSLSVPPNTSELWA
jgi:hypothetical protein